MSGEEILTGRESWTPPNRHQRRAEVAMARKKNKNRGSNFTKPKRRKK